ncbi:hypothetical protein T484DRAFT_1797931 [Baffinella frigidus]|nr:hypothetical protein T484DRAFT_1797931 [Cryptophyta sp. CCMP2293]
MLPHVLTPAVRHASPSKPRLTPMRAPFSSRQDQAVAHSPGVLYPGRTPALSVGLDSRIVLGSLNSGHNVVLANNGAPQSGSLASFKEGKASATAPSRTVPNSHTAGDGLPAAAGLAQQQGADAQHADKKQHEVAGQNNDPARKEDDGASGSGTRCPQQDGGSGAPPQRPAHASSIHELAANVASDAEAAIPAGLAPLHRRPAPALLVDAALPLLDPVLRCGSTSPSPAGSQRASLGNP